MADKFILFHTRGIREGEVMGQTYHYRNEEHLKKLEQEGRIKIAYINKQAQGIALKTFDDKYTFKDPKTNIEYKGTAKVVGLDTVLAGNTFFLAEVGLAWFEFLREEYKDTLTTIFISPFSDEYLEPFEKKGSSAIDKEQEELKEYNKRLARRAMTKEHVSKLKKKHSEDSYDSQKFFSDGRTKPFYGLTCIALIKPTTELHKRLYNLQTRIINTLTHNGLRETFSFLEPEFFHMTICDVDPSNKYNKEKQSYVKVGSQQLKERLVQVKKAFEDIGAPGKIYAQVKGIGLTIALTALVRFSNPKELAKILTMETIIKGLADVNKREFAGHISLAYLAKYPGDAQFNRVVAILRELENEDLGEVIFENFDFTYFSDMNHFIPLINKNLINGEFAEYPNNIYNIENRENRDSAKLFDSTGSKASSGIEGGCVSYQKSASRNILEFRGESF